MQMQDTNSSTFKPPMRKRIYILQLKHKVMTRSWFKFILQTIFTWGINSEKNEIDDQVLDYKSCIPKHSMFWNYPLHPPSLKLPVHGSVQHLNHEITTEENASSIVKTGTLQGNSCGIKHFKTSKYGKAMKIYTVCSLQTIYYSCHSTQ